MVDTGSDFLQTFLFSPLGILSQAAIFIATIFPFFKYLNKRLDERITKTVDERVKPVVDSLCNQLHELSNNMKDTNNATNVFKTKIETSIKYIDRAMMTIQGVKESKESTDREGGC